MKSGSTSLNILRRTRERLESLDCELFDDLVRSGLPCVSREMSIEDIDRYYDEIYYFDAKKFRFFLFCAVSAILKDVEKSKVSLSTEALSRVPFWNKYNPILSNELADDIDLISDIYTELWKCGAFYFSDRDIKNLSTIKEGRWPSK